MKTIIKLLIAALALNAAVQAGRAAWRYYDFKDAVEQMARHESDDTAATLQAQILRLAEERGIAIYPADVVVEKNTGETKVSAVYGEVIEFVPRLYRREHLFEFAVSVRPMRPLPIDQIK